jgi:hypothetical protein
LFNPMAPIDHVRHDVLHVVQHHGWGKLCWGILHWGNYIEEAALGSRSGGECPVDMELPIPDNSS